jgi:antitoxin (DNA-binding transcriptional repressor) of toxin-antitoxin stability system
MKTIEIQNTDLNSCVLDAQSTPVVVTRAGNPVALVVGVQGLDEEQIELGASDRFWELISSRRKEKGLDRAALENRLESNSRPDGEQ